MLKGSISGQFMKEGSLRSAWRMLAFGKTEKSESCIWRRNGMAEHVKTQKSLKVIGNSFVTELSMC